MKKFSLILLLLLVGAIGFTSEYVHYGFSVKCAKCVELAEKGVSLEKQIAWRTHHYREKDGKTYAMYRCQGGHQYWAEIR